MHSDFGEMLFTHFGVNVDDLSTARARLERVEADICPTFVHQR